MSRKQRVQAALRQAVIETLEARPQVVKETPRYRGAPIRPYIRPTPARASWPVMAVVCIDEPFDPTEPHSSVVCFTRLITTRKTAIDKPWEPRMRYIGTDQDGEGEPGVWTMEIVREWFTEAIQAGRRMAMEPNTKPSTQCVAMLEVIHGWESYGHNDVEMRAPLPTAAELARMDRVLPDWLLLVDGDDAIRQRKAMIGVGLRLNLRAIGDDLGCHHETARALQKRGFARVAERLNAGERTAGLDMAKMEAW